MRGRSGIGKSDLGIRLIDSGAKFVGDDQIELFTRGPKLAMRPCAPGLIELRNLGLFVVPHISSATVDLLIDLDFKEPPERLPYVRSESLLGISIPVIRFDPRPPSSTARLKILLTAERAA